MDIKDKFPSAFVREYERFRITGIKGMLPGEAGGIRRALMGERGVEVSSVISQPGRDFLMAFAVEQPIVDLTFVVEGSGGSSIVTLGLDATRQDSLIESLIVKSCFSPDASLDPDFSRVLIDSFNVEVAAYRTCLAAAKTSGKNFDDLYATARYANFLQQSGRYPEEAALVVAWDRYNNTRSQQRRE